MRSTTYTKLPLSSTLLSHLRTRFIAFDTETTGLDAYYNRIIEVGAVLFEDGKPVREYGSLVHTVNSVPYEAYMVNRISDAMVRSAPPPAQVFSALMDFFGDAVQGNTILVGHNATFDMKFLDAELRRMGKAGDFLYADTCQLSRIVLPALYSHTQDAVARHLGVENRMKHRAVTDAQTCGEIMVRMLPMLERNEKIVEQKAKEAEKRAKCVPDEEERALCCQLSARAGEIGRELYFQKSGKIIQVRGYGPLFAMNLAARKPYLVAEQEMLERMEESLEERETQPPTATEAKPFRNPLRVFVPKEAIPEAALELVMAALASDCAPENCTDRWTIARERETFVQIM